MMIENPEWRDAPVELGFIPLNGGLPVYRFKTHPPLEVHDTPNGFSEWIEKNAIPQFIEVP